MERKELAKEIAEYVIKEGTTYTDNGSWCVYFEDIDRLFDTDLESNDELVSMVEEYFDPDIISEYEICDDCFDMMFYWAYCDFYDEDEEEE